MNSTLVKTVAVALLLGAAASAAMARRVALVIGNGQYQYENTLANPVNDATLIEQALKSQGFTVEKKLNLGKREMDLAIKRFTRESAGADTAVFYYAGHGAQPSKGGKSYLLPVDSHVTDDDSLDTDGLAADGIAQQLEQQPTPPRLRIVILDACRNSKFALANGTRGGGVRGLAPPSRTDDYTLIAYSTDANNVAQDGAGSHSPYAQALADQLKRSASLPIRAVFEETAKQVREQTRGSNQQRPRTYGDLGSKIGWDGVELASMGVVPTPDYKPSLPGQPSGGAVSLDDLERADKEEAQRKAQWAAWQKQMKAAYDKVAQLSSEATRLKGWERFIATYEGQHNPYSDEDEVLVAKAKQALGELQQARQQAPQQTLARQQTTSGPKAGSSFRDCTDCPEMVWLPKGRFTMGSPNSESGHSVNEGPQHEVNINYDLAVGKYAVTFDEWAACVNGGGCASKPNPGDSGWGRGRRPVIDVSWNDAKEYVAWLSRKTGKSYRLLSEAEWEYAARGGTTTPFYTGECINTSQANHDGRDDYNRCGAKTGTYLAKTQAVGSYAPNAWGMYDMAGNVWQWVEDVYHNNYSGAPSDGSAWVSGGDQLRRVLRGGSWNYDPANLRSANRFRNNAAVSYVSFGFRLARTN